MCYYEVHPDQPIIEIHVSCENLVSLDIGSKSDSICIFKTDQNGKFVEESRTEVVFDNPNPNYVNSFKINHVQGSKRSIRFEIYDFDRENKKRHQLDDFIGFCETDMQYVGSHLNSPLRFDLKKENKKGKRGQIILIAEQFKQCSLNLQGVIQAAQLKKKKTFAKNNPYFEVSKPSTDGQNILVYRSEANYKCYSCTFNRFTIPIHSLCRKSIDETITISFYDFTNKKPPKLIGRYDSTIKNFINSKNSTFELQEGNSTKSAGQFKFTEIELVQIPTFADYLRSGIQIKPIIAIDFSNSNQKPNNWGSLHLLSKNPKGMNQYQKCISSVGKVMTKYVKDNKFSIFGYGAKYDDQDTYVFPLTYDIKNTEVNGVQGMLDAYLTTIQKVKLWNPNELAPIINETREKAVLDFDEFKKYTVLIIMTNCLYTDIGTTINAVVEASDAPISIVIVAVGREICTHAWQLENSPIMTDDNKVMKRKIVHFMRFDQLCECTEERLEMEIMREIPNQIHSYCSTHGFVPEMPKCEFQ